METALIVVSVIGGGFIATLLMVFLVMKNRKEKKETRTANTTASTPPQTTPSQGGGKIDSLKNIHGKEWFWPLVLAIGLIAAIGVMYDGLPWWGFLWDNKAGALVLIAALIAGTIVYPKKAVPILGILLLLSLGFYFGPKVTAAREGPKSAAQVGFFDGDVQLKAGVWSKTIFVKGGFDYKGPPNVPYIIKINGIKEIKCDGKGNVVIPVSEGIVKSIQFQYPIDTMITFTQLTK